MSSSPSPRARSTRALFWLAPPALAGGLALSALSLASPAEAGPGPSSLPAGTTSSVLGYESVASREKTRMGAATSLISCTASVVDLPGVGPRLVTARHCQGTEPRLYDPQRSVRPGQRHELDDGPDIAVFEAGQLPWKALPTRSPQTLQKGETLCAFRVTHDRGAYRRQEICGPYLGRGIRLDGGAPQLVIGHTYEHGTSGSPLFDQKGRVVGVVVATSATEGYAEPIDEASRVARGPAVAPGQNPPPSQPITLPPGVWNLPDVVPSKGSVCLGGLVCLSWSLDLG